MAITKSAIDIIILAIIYTLFLFPRWEKQGKDRLAVKSLMYLYIVLVLYVTIMPIAVSLQNISITAYKPMNMVPFDDYLRGRGDALRQIILNVVMMVPFGFLLPTITGRRFFFCVFMTFLFSLSIELVQPLMGNRTSDVTDLITNTVGGIIGYILYLIFRPLTNTVLQKLKNNK